MRRSTLTVASVASLVLVAGPAFAGSQTIKDDSGDVTDYHYTGANPTPGAIDLSQATLKVADGTVTVSMKARDVKPTTKGFNQLFSGNIVPKNKNDYRNGVDFEIGTGSDKPCTVFSIKDGTSTDVTASSTCKINYDKNVVTFTFPLSAVPAKPKRLLGFVRADALTKDNGTSHSDYVLDFDTPVA